MKEYLRQGVQPIATLLPDEPSDHLIQAGVDFFPLDVTKNDSIVQLKEQVHKLTGGSLHILVNNA